MDNGFFGMLFDIDGDGELSDFERATDLGAFVHMIEEDDDEGDENLE